MKAMNQKRRQRFAREFPGIDQIPGFDHVRKIKVQKVNSILLRGSGVEYRLPDETQYTSFTSIIFYVVGWGLTTKLQPEVYYRGSSNWGTKTLPDNGEQIFRLSLVGRPDFIVQCEIDGSGLQVWTIYKADKFDWEEYFKEFKSRYFEDPNSLLAFRRRRWG